MNIITNYSEYKAQQKQTLEINKPMVKQIKNLPEYKPDFLDKLSEKVVNKRDINDMVKVPRAIFKGYLCFTTGTALNSIAFLIKNSKFAKCLNIAGSIMSIYGTYNFVKPFLIKEKNLTKH